jgi:predicted dinucleotide-binding enzyme
VFDCVAADLFYAAEEGHAKDVADKLIADVGLEPVWLGGVDAFDVVDSLTRLWFQPRRRDGRVASGAESRGASSSLTRTLESLPW